MKKKFLIIIIAILIILIILVLIYVKYFKNDYPDVTLSTSDIMTDMVTKLGNEVTPMMTLDEQQVKDIYDIDALKLENYVIKIPMMNIRADEIAIIKVKNMKDVEYVKNKFKIRVKNIQNTFEGYLEDQYELAKNSLIISLGKYILMSVSDKNDDIETVFKSYFDNK